MKTGEPATYCTRQSRVDLTQHELQGAVVACLLRRYPDNALLASDVASVDWYGNAYLIMSIRLVVNNMGFEAREPQ